MENSNLNSFQQGILADTLIGVATEQGQFNLFSMLKPKIYQDGKAWCVLYGDDPMTGIVGYGDSPVQAISRWSNEWYKKIKP